MLLIAMDRAPTVRKYDADGRLHVAVSNISKANVCPYLGREVPGWAELGLEPDRLYNFLRDPDELARGAATFNNLPVLSEHVPVTAATEDSHIPEIVVGSTGTDAAFDGEYLTNSLVVWAKPSIDGVVNNRKRQLSSAYRWRPDMTPGEYEGIAYHGVMRDIVGNHVALVFEGRAGSDVIIGDEKPMALKSMRALMLAGGLGGLIRPLLAQDAKFDLGAVLADVNDQSIAPADAKAALADRVFGLAQPYLAADAALDVTQVRAAIEAVGGMALDGDDVIPDAPAAPANPPAPVNPAAPAVPPVKEDPPAMDQATVQQMVDKARNDALAESAAIRTAEKEVGAVVGELAIAADSASAVYKAGLQALNVDLNGLDESSYGATFRAVAAVRAAPAPLAQDSRPSATVAADFNQRFPNRAKLIKG